MLINKQYVTCCILVCPTCLLGKENENASAMITYVHGFIDCSAFGATITLLLTVYLDNVLIFLVAEDEVSGSSTF